MHRAGAHSPPPRAKILATPMKIAFWSREGPPASVCNASTSSAIWRVLMKIKIIKATPTIVGEAFIFYLWTFFCHAPILPRDDAAALRQKYISG